MENILKIEKVYSILELNNTIRNILKTEFPDYIWVAGEIQDLKLSRDRRHVFFSLAEKHPEIDQVVAQVGAIIFESYKNNILKKLEELDFKLRDGLEIKIKCEVDLYPRQGSFRLIVVDIDPLYTIGKLSQSRQKVIEKLNKEGLLEKNKSIFIPEISLRIGLITAYNSAAYWDFLDELKKSKYGFYIIVYDCYMQGRYTEEDIVYALNYFNKFDKDSLDVIVITRGGGSMADLSWFDNENIARAIAFSKIPVITALGHQINFTVADLVANTSLKTPTKAAQFLIDRIRGFMDKLRGIEKNISQYIKNLLILKKSNLENFIIKIESYLLRYFRFHRDELLDKKGKLNSISKIFFIARKKELEEIRSFIKLHLEDFFKKHKNDLKYKEEKINILDPKNILKRGYSITLKNSKPIREVDNVNIGDIIETILYKGILTSNITKKYNEQKNDIQSGNGRVK